MLDMQRLTRAIIVLQGVVKKNGRDYTDTDINAGRNSSFHACLTFQRKTSPTASGRRWRESGRHCSHAEASTLKASGEDR